MHLVLYVCVVDHCTQSVYDDRNGLHACIWYGMSIDHPMCPKRKPVSPTYSGGPHTGVVTMPKTPGHCTPMAAACSPPGIALPTQRFQLCALAPQTCISLALAWAPATCPNVTRGAYSPRSRATPHSSACMKVSYAFLSHRAVHAHFHCCSAWPVSSQQRPFPPAIVTRTLESACSRARNSA